MRIDLIASLPHYQTHMLPIFEALPEELRGDIHPLRETVHPPLGGRAAMVAGWQDLRVLRGRCQMIYVEHGAGQAYLGDEKMATLPGYSGGGAQHSSVIGYICPSQTVADRWLRASIAVGSPKMDRHIGSKPSEPESVCFTFHWPCTLGPECQTALPHYAEQIPEIVGRFQEQGFTVYAHNHPRWDGIIDPLFLNAGATLLSHDDMVFERCGILIADNTSLQFEFASLGRPVVTLNAPWYRRDVEHGLRFWSHVPGIMIDEPDRLLRLNLWDVLTDDVAEILRSHAVGEAYAHVDGRAAQRAADFISQLIGDK